MSRDPGEKSHQNDVGTPSPAHPRRPTRPDRVGVRGGTSPLTAAHARRLVTCRRAWDPGCSLRLDRNRSLLTKSLSGNLIVRGVLATIVGIIALAWPDVTAGP